MIGPSWEGLAFAALPALLVGLILAGRGLGQVRPLALSIVRMTLQLLLLGAVLKWVFANQNPALIGGIALIMLLTSAHTVASRQPGSRWALRIEAFVSLAATAAAVMALSLRLGLRVEPWYEARTAIPLLGMVLGNSVNGVALAAERLDAELRADRDLVELRLALGATSRQAALPALRSAVRAALTPITNNMMIAGIVSIPGMTTGQILAGADVLLAVRFQILVYLAIAGTAGLSTLALLGLRLRGYFTPALQLRADRFDPLPG